MSKLSAAQIGVYLGKLPQWKFENNALLKTFKLPDFAGAIQFVCSIAALAESANHHPDLLIRNNRVSVTLTTHDSFGVTGKDFLLAQQIDAIKL